MRGLTYFAAMMALFAAMIFAQSSTSTPSDQSSSSQSSAQSQNQTNSDTSSRDKNRSRMHDHHADTSAPTVRSPAASEPSTMTRPSDQQPSSSTSQTSSQAYLAQTPAARAVATHTPDPGTCMNPAALQAAENGNQPRPGPPCD
jgi:spore germination protein GerM